MTGEIKEFIKSIAISIVAAFLIITFVFEGAIVDGFSMIPTLNDKDLLIVEKVTYYFRQPQPGDIIVIRYPANPKEKFVKRVVAVGGDKVKIESNKVYVNGKVRNENFTLEKWMNNYSEVTVPKGTLFLLGDNRNDSRDSRFPDVGFVNLKLVIGKASFRIYPLKNIGILKSQKG